MRRKSEKSVVVLPAVRNRGFFEALSEGELDAIWAQRATLGLTESEVLLLRHLLRERKGFKPADPFVSICQRCNLPADNCACHR